MVSIEGYDEIFSSDRFRSSNKGVSYERTEKVNLWR